MTRTYPTSKALSPVTAGTERYCGEVAYLYAFDLAYDMRHEPIRTLLGQQVRQFSLAGGKRMPRDVFFFQPEMVRLPTIERQGRIGGQVRISPSIKLFPVGAVSITLRVPFENQTLEELVAYHELDLPSGQLHDEARQLAERIHQELLPLAIRPVLQLREEEAYTVFCLDSRAVAEQGQDTETWLRQHRREVAALLTQEPRMSRLSNQEVNDTTGRYLSYYDHDLVVADWDAALVIDEPHTFDETLHIMELANVQLAELEAYDRQLDEAVERSYVDLGNQGILSRSSVLNGLREIRVDLARLSDELSNITKFFGDWHLARVYQTVSARFHLSDWHATIDQKLQTLDDLYKLLKQDQVNRWMMMLEIMIVLLFIVDVAVIVLAGWGK